MMIKMMVIQITMIIHNNEDNSNDNNVEGDDDNGELSFYPPGKARNAGEAEEFTKCLCHLEYATFIRFLWSPFPHFHYHFFIILISSKTFLLFSCVLRRYPLEKMLV